MRTRKNRQPGRRLAAVTCGVVAAGVMALGTSPASAAPYWQVVDTDTGPQWLCGPTKIHKAKSGVGFQTCVVVNSKADAQAVLVVVNNSKDAITLSGGVRTDFGADADCYSSTLNPGFQRGCFGPTVHVGAGGISAYSYLRVNGVVDYSQGN
ncbi:hypothetical protein [Streptomyces sp. NPDC056337]|uniref:hypothetical protein n=1 Tax=Streptomyces sp. NPDC056337 TaxID=3345787 RepID=UPI0035DDA967